MTRDRRALATIAVVFSALVIAACIPPRGEPPILNTTSTSTTAPPTSLDIAFGMVTGSGCLNNVCNFLRELDITNTGDNPTTAGMEITFSNFSGTIAELSTPDGCSGTTLAAGDSCTVVLHFRNSVEVYTGTINIEAGNTSYNSTYDAFAV